MAGPGGGVSGARRVHAAVLHRRAVRGPRCRRGVLRPRARLSGRLFAGPEELLDAVVADVRRHTGGGANDDMALLAVARPAERRPEPGAKVPVTAAEEESRPRRHAV